MYNSRVTTPRVRFAPSPTGYLHIGGARTALFNWLYARHTGGVFMLRIEDTDEVRSTHASVDAILESMAWLGLDWDEGPVFDPANLGRGEEAPWAEKGPYAPYFQMRRQEHYREHAARLEASGQAYRCYCTPEELDEMRRRAQLEKRPPRYDGRCRGLSAAERSEREGKGLKHVLRFAMPRDGATVVHDMIRGEVSFENNLQQDLVIQKTSGIPTYNFACVVDDHTMKITDVIRGEEHLSNTPSQIQLYRALGWEPPRFAHLSMILGPDGAKLSKRHGATSVLEYRNQGYLPEALRNYLALLGWSTPDSQQLFDPKELVEKFDLGHCQKNPATFDPQKLEWLNGEKIRALPASELVAQARPFLSAAGMPHDGPQLLKAVALEHEKTKLLSQVPQLVDFFFKDAAYDPASVQKTLKAPGVQPMLRDLAAKLKALEPFETKALEAAIRAFVTEKGLKAGQVFHPLRVSVSGRTTGPSLFEMLELLGKDRVLARLDYAARELAAA